MINRVWLEFNLADDKKFFFNLGGNLIWKIFTKITESANFSSGQNFVPIRGVEKADLITNIEYENILSQILPWTNWHYRSLFCKGNYWWLPCKQLWKEIKIISRYTNFKVYRGLLEGVLHRNLKLFKICDTVFYVPGKQRSESSWDRETWLSRFSNYRYTLSNIHLLSLPFSFS